MGGFRTYYADSLDATAGSVSADAAWSSPRTRFGLAGSFASFASDGWAAQGAGSWTRLLAGGGGRGILVSADANGYTFNTGTWAGAGTAALIGALPLGPFAGALTGSVGGVRRLDGTDDPLAQATARLWRDAGVVSVDAWGAVSRAGVQHYGDLGAGVRAEWTNLIVDLSGGGRFGDLGDVGWAQARVALRVTGPGWLEVSGGRYPPDVTGYATGSFVQAGMRVSLGRAPGRTVSRPDAALAVEHESDGTVVLTFSVSGREPVEIAGDWNSWTPQPVTPAGPGRWRARLVLDPGLHRFTLIDRSGEAFVPEGIPAEPDDFGSSTGLISVPRR